MAHGNDINNKRYYWLKLDRHFFNNARIKKLRKLAGGDTYTIIYLKLMLLSIEFDGVLVYEGIEETFEKELALKIEEADDDVLVTINYLKVQGLIEEHNEEYFLPEAHNSVGSETKNNVYKRIGNEKKRLEKFQPNSNQIPIDIDKEKDIELDNIESKKESKEINILSNTHAHESYDDIISDFGVSEELKPALIEFIRHCQINKKVVTNDKLKNIIIRLDMNNNSETEKIQSLKRAINGGYFDILEGR